MQLPESSSFILRFRSVGGEMVVYSSGFLTALLACEAKSLLYLSDSKLPFTGD